MSSVAPAPLPTASTTSARSPAPRAGFNHLPHELQIMVVQQALDATPPGKRMTRVVRNLANVSPHFNNLTREALRQSPKLGLRFSRERISNTWTPQQYRDALDASIATGHVDLKIDDDPPLEQVETLAHLNSKADQLRSVRVDYAEDVLQAGDLHTAISQNPHLWSKVTALHASDNELDDQDARAVGQLLAGASRLRTLNLTHNNITDDGAASIGAHLNASSLIRLYLNGNQVGDSTALAIARTLPESSLQHLNLSNAEVRFRDPDHTTATDHDHRSISDVGAVPLGQAVAHSNLTRLHLQGHRITDEGARALAQSLRHAPVQHLNLSANDITNEGARAIGHALETAPLQSPLVTLVLSGNDIQSPGATALVQALPHSNVRILNLAGNHITDNAAVDIAQVLPHTQLTHLNLDFNPISPSGRAALVNKVVESKVRHIRLNDAILGDATNVRIHLPDRHTLEIHVDDPSEPAIQQLQDTYRPHHAGWAIPNITIFAPTPLADRRQD